MEDPRGSALPKAEKALLQQAGFHSPQLSQEKTNDGRPTKPTHSDHRPSPNLGFPCTAAVSLSEWRKAAVDLPSSGLLRHLHVLPLSSIILLFLSKRSLKFFEESDDPSQLEYSSEWVADCDTSQGFYLR